MLFRLTKHSQTVFYCLPFSISLTLFHVNIKTYFVFINQGNEGQQHNNHFFLYYLYIRRPLFMII